MFNGNTKNMLLPSGFPYRYSEYSENKGADHFEWRILGKLRQCCACNLNMQVDASVKMNGHSASIS
jgi:hypothetical protein